MTSHSQRAEELAHLSLADHCVYLGCDGTLTPYARTAGFFRTMGTDPALKDGRALALHHIHNPEDVHYPIWEMHPDGDELLLLVSGSLAVEFRESGGGQAKPFPSNTAFIVPAGTWHRLVVNEPSVLISVTPLHGTLHRSNSDGTSHRRSAERSGARARVQSQE